MDDPRDLVGFQVTPAQLIAAGCCLAAVVLIGFYLAARGRSSR